MSNSTKVVSGIVIKVIGVGGGGSNAVNYMSNENILGVDFFVVNTDVQALSKMSVKKKIQIGKNITKGLGAGADPKIGRKSAEEDKDLFKSILNGADMIFIASGMGGGTGTGASPVIAKIAKELNILTVAVVTKPFSFEGKKRMNFAYDGIYDLYKFVDSLIIISNDKLLKICEKNISLLQAFNLVNDVLKNAVKGISELITKPSLINVDFADVYNVMSEMGCAVMSTGLSCGENRAIKAIKEAVSSPLLEDINLSNVKGILINITSGLDFKLNEFEVIGNSINSFSSEKTTLVMGTSLDSSMNNKLRVTLIATGICLDENIEVNFLNNKFNYSALNENFFKKKKIKNSNCVSKKKFIKNYNFMNLDVPLFLKKKID